MLRLSISKKTNAGKSNVRRDASKNNVEDNISTESFKSRISLTDSEVACCIGESWKKVNMK